MKKRFARLLLASLLFLGIGLPAAVGQQMESQPSKPMHHDVMKQSDMEQHQAMSSDMSSDTKKMKKNKKEKKQKTEKMDKKHNEMKKNDKM